MFLARRTGRTVVLNDLPVEGLVTATRRTTREGLGARASAVVAAGQILPLRPRAFDAVVHTDVLCCLRPKLELLRVTFRVAEQFADDLVRMLGRHDYDEMQVEGRTAVAAVTGGLLRRSMFMAGRPRRDLPGGRGITR